MSIQEKITRKKIRRIMTKALKDDGMPQHDIEMFFSKSAAGEFLRDQTAAGMIANGVKREEVELIMKYTV